MLRKASRFALQDGQLNMKLSAFKTNKKAETDGVWVDGGNGLELLLARVPNPKYEACMRQLGRPHAELARIGLDEDGVFASIHRQAIARHVLLGWRNLVDDQDKEIKYSVENAEKFLEEYPDFLRLVLNLAQNRQLFLDATVKQTADFTAGNSNGVPISAS
jgi:hypothetical protein